VTRQLDGLVIKGTANKEAAFISIARKVLGEAKSAFELGMQEVLHGDGRAIKGTVASSADTTHCRRDQPVRHQRRRSGWPAAGRWECRSPSTPPT